MALPKWIVKSLFYFQVFLSFLSIIGVVIVAILAFSVEDNFFEDWTRADLFQFWIDFCLSGYWVYYFFSKFKIEDEKMVNLVLLLYGIVTLGAIVNYEKYGLVNVLAYIFELGVSVYFFKFYDFFNDKQIQ